MKTLRYRIGDQVRPGILDQNEKIRDASSIVPDWDDQNITVEKLNEVKKNLNADHREDLLSFADIIDFAEEKIK